jgi:hypothetical protein
MDKLNLFFDMGKLKDIPKWDTDSWLWDKLELATSKEKENESTTSRPSCRPVPSRRRAPIS